MAKVRKPAIDLTPDDMRSEHIKRERMKFTDLHNYEIEQNMRGIMGKPSKGKPRQVQEAVKIQKRIARKSKRKLGDY